MGVRGGGLEGYFFYCDNLIMDFLFGLFFFFQSSMSVYYLFKCF